LVINIQSIHDARSEKHQVKVRYEQGFLLVFWFSSVTIIKPIFRNHI